MALSLPLPSSAMALLTVESSSTSINVTVLSSLPVAVFQFVIGTQEYAGASVVPLPLDAVQASTPQGITLELSPSSGRVFGFLSSGGASAPPNSDELLLMLEFAQEALLPSSVCLEV